MKEENKRKFALWIYPQTLKRIEKAYRTDNCKSSSEFIEKAVLFYLGHIASEQNTNYLAKEISSLVKGTISNTENRLSRLMFKQAVEQAKVAKMLAQAYKYNPAMMSDLHWECVEEVKKINGFIKLPPSENWGN